MHYKNGREAKPGDQVINLESGKGGIIHSLQAQSTTCNARLATPSPNDEYVTLSKCLHIDDVRAAAFPAASDDVADGSNVDGCKIVEVVPQ